MIRYIVAILAFFIALGANAALYMRSSTHPSVVEGSVKFKLGQQTNGQLILNVPRNVLREANHASVVETARVELIVAIENFSPLPPPSPLNLEDKLPDTLSLVLAREAVGSVEPFQALYARFLSRETAKLPSGLIKRRFRAGTPFEDRELFIGAGARLFVALCAIELEALKEPCIARIRQDGLEIQLRFDAKYLPQWQRLAGEASRLVSSLVVKERT